jgi:hypothetical protein
MDFGRVLAAFGDEFKAGWNWNNDRSFGLYVLL